MTDNDVTQVRDAIRNIRIKRELIIYNNDHLVSNIFSHLPNSTDILHSRLGCGFSRFYLPR